MRSEFRLLSHTNGIPNFFKAAKLAAVASALHRGNPKYPFKRRARRNEAGMYVLAYLMAAKETQIELKKPNAEQLKALKRAINELHANVSVEYEVLLELLGELLGVIDLANRREGLQEDLVMLDAFGGYGTFSLAALNLGLKSVYVELNPVAAFLFRTYIQKTPYGSKKKAEEFIERLEKECSEIFPGDQYFTIRARPIKCPKCGAHVPFFRVKYDNKYYYNCLRWGNKNVKKTYLVEYEYDEGFKRKRRFSLSEISGPKDRKFRCPNCGHEIYIGKQRKKLHEQAFEDYLSLYDVPAKELKRAYAIPVAKAYRSPIRLEELDEREVEAIERAMEELEERREEFEEFIPQDPLPERSIDESSHGITEISRVVRYRYQLMSPRQLICYAKAIKRIKKQPERIRQRLAMLLALSLQQNVLTRFETSSSGVKHISANQTYGFFPVVAELNIPGDKEGSFRSIFNRTSLKIEIKNLGIKLHSGFKLAEDAFSLEPGKVLVLNEPVQELSVEADVAFVDPPFKDNMPYWDLSRLYYVRLKKIFGERLPGTKYTLDEIYELDLTDSNDERYYEKLSEALRRLGENVREYLVLHITREAKKDLLERLAMLGEAIIKADLLPAFATQSLLETSKTKGTGNVNKSRSVLVLLLPPDKALDYYESLGLKVPDEGDDPIAHFYAYYMPLLRRILEEYKIPLDDAIIIARSLLTSIAYFALPELDHSKIESMLFSVLRDVIESALNPIYGIEEAYKLIKKYPITALYAITITYGQIDATLLKSLELEEYAKKVLKEAKGKSFSGTAYEPKRLYELLKGKLEEKELLFYALRIIKERYPNPDAIDVNELKHYPISYFDSSEKDLAKMLKKAIETYAIRLHEEIDKAEDEKKKEKLYREERILMAIDALLK